MANIRWIVAHLSRVAEFHVKLPYVKGQTSDQLIARFQSDICSNWLQSLVEGGKTIDISMNWEPLVRVWETASWRDFGKRNSKHKKLEVESETQYGKLKRNSCRGNLKLQDLQSENCREKPQAGNAFQVRGNWRISKWEPEKQENSTRKWKRSGPELEIL